MIFRRLCLPLVLGVSFFATSAAHEQNPEPSVPPDSTVYTRRAVAEDLNPGGKPALGPHQTGTPMFPRIFVRDVVVNNTDSSTLVLSRFLT